MVFVLLVSLLITAMPVYAVSSANTPELNETIGTNEIDNNTISSAETDSIATTPTKLTDKDDVYISAEEVSRRGEFEKHYLLSDGSFVAVSYPEAVHYKNDDGKWEEVDNQLSYDSKTSRIVNGQNGFSVSFAEKPSGNSLASLLHDGIPFSWTLSATKKLNSGKETKLTAFSASTANIIQAEKVSLASTVSRANIAETSIIGKKVTDADAFTNDKLSGKLGYTKLFNDAPEISVDYSVYHNKIEEDIYINSPTDLRSFSMEIQANGLTAIVNDDGSVDFVDADGTMQYRIGIPYMQDANNEVLNDIEVTATLNGDVWTVTYTPDEEWLTSEERAYPILLDPSVTTKEYNSNITDTYISNGDTANHSSEQYLYIGVKSGYVHRTYVKLNNFPYIPDSAPILGATMQLSFVSGTTTGKTAQVYKVISDWTPSDLIYEDQPAIFSDYYLSSCAYNSSIQSLTFDITDDIVNIHDNFFATYNHGYVVKYENENPNDNPDYNMFCSMEHTNVSKRPVVTINYGYTLPDCLINGGVYAFQNTVTDNFITVQDGTDANDVNVIPEWVDEDEITYELEDRHFFKIEYIPSAGAYYIRAMCSSNGTNRVLDVVKQNGYPADDSTVQIYNPTDPLAQHWLIISTGNNKFKIVLRNAPGLMITENTYLEDIELMYRIYDDETSYPEWRIYNDDGHMISSPYNTSIDNDIYYFNNLHHGKYLHNANGTPNATSGFISNLGDTIRWKVTRVGNNTYTIQSADDLTKYLRSVDSLYVGLSTPTTLTNEYLWKISLSGSTGGGMLIQNVATSKYLRQYTGSSLTSGSVLGTPGTQLYNECVWRTASQAYYTGKELTDSFTIDDVIVGVGESKTPTINKAPSNALFSSASDFTYSCVTTGYVTVENGVFSGQNEGGTTVIATHKPTNLQFTFSAAVGDTPILVINNYIDQGYSVRFEDYPDISEYYDVVCGKLEDLFELNCYITYSTITSSADICKIQQFGAVTADNLAEDCTHSDDHLTTDALRAGMSSGTKINSYVLWTGHILTDNLEDRSNSSDYSVVITSFKTTKCDYSNKNVSEVRIESVFDLMHELSHQLGAPDHYCYNDDGESGNCDNDYCDQCFGNMEKPRNCIMSYRYNIEEKEDALYCDSCIDTINNHLSGHHQ